MKKHSGGCACGKVMYHTIGQPVKTGLCHCRYCQLRTGTAFGISVYFKKENLKIKNTNFEENFDVSSIQAVFDGAMELCLE